MKSDLTCPVEVVSIEIQRENGDTNENGLIVCLIDFYNLSEKAVDSIQMNLICYNAENVRLGGRLVRASARGEGRTRFSGAFMPEHVDDTVRVEASVEKVWFQDGVIWRREEENVREYMPNQLPEGRELDRLRSVAGPDAAGYAREEDALWLCVCGRANSPEDENCRRCHRERAYVLKNYSFAAIDATLGRKERMLEEKTRDTLIRSSEQTVEEMKTEQKRQNKRKRRVKRVILILVLAAGALAALRWGVPYAASQYAEKRLNEGLSADAKKIYAFVDTYWPGEFGSREGMEEAERRIIDGLISVNTENALFQAAQRAEALGDAQRMSQAVIARAQLCLQAEQPEDAEKLLAELPEDEEAQKLRKSIIYDMAEAARTQLDFETAIARFDELGDYEDAPEQKDETIYLYGRHLMRAGEYEKACSQFMQVTGEPDAISHIRQCRYAMAQQYQKAGNYLEAAPLYESLGVYEEAETRGRFCRYTAGSAALQAGNLEEAAEQFKMAEDYEDAAERFADIALTLGSAALEAGRNQEAIGWLEQLPYTEDIAEMLNRAIYAYASDLEKEGQKELAVTEFSSLGGYSDARTRANRIEYDLALSYMDSNPEEALVRFEALGDYEDAHEQAISCRFLMAQNAMEAGEYQQALERFEALGDARDAREQAVRCRYALAEQAMKDADYEKAAGLFEKCGTYRDSEDSVFKARYAQAQALYDTEKYQEAAKVFESLGSYEDAKQRVTESEDAWLNAAYVAAQMDMELGDYQSVIDGLEAYADEDLPERYDDIPGMYVKACLNRAQELTGTNRPLDALPILQRIPNNKTAQKRLEAYVYQIIGRWKDKRGVEYIFRPDGSCTIAGKDGYFGGSGYEIRVGDEPYPTQGAYTVVSLRNKSLTLRSIETEKAIHLTYLGEPEQEEKGEE